MPSVVSAQKLDETQESLAGLYLDYIKTINNANTTEAYRDVTYWNLFGMRQKGWNGGMHCTSIPLPDGNCLWLHADSYFGRISEIRNRRDHNTRVNNAAQIQTGEESASSFVSLNQYISTDPNQPATYYMAYDWIRHPEAKTTQDYLDVGRADRDHYLRPLDGTLIMSQGKPHVQIVLLSYNSDDVADGMYIAEFSVDGTPADADYMHLLKLQRMPYVANFGCSIVETPDCNYLYGNVPAAVGNGYDLVVARTTGRSLFSQWEYYVADANGGKQWQTQLPTVEQLQASKINAATKVVSPAAFRYGDDYFVVSQQSTGGSIQIGKASAPEGPFKIHAVVYIPEAEEGTIGDIAVHPHMSRMGELVISYTTNPVPTTVYWAAGDGKPIVTTQLSSEDRLTNGWGSANLALPHFIRVFNWQGWLGVSDEPEMQDSALQVWDLSDGIATAEADARLGVYPTSMHDVLNIDTAIDAARPWSLTNQSGAVVMSGQVAGHTAIDVSALAKGVYMVNVAGMGTVKVVKN